MSVTVIGCVQADVLMREVTELPEPGATLLTEQMSLRVGGAGANAALALAETGTPVRLLGCVGDDMLGRFMRETVTAAGIADELAVVAQLPTGLTVALQSRERDRTFLTYLGVNAEWGPESVPTDALSCDGLLLCDYFVAPRMQGDAARELLEGARRAGAATYFDTAFDPMGFAPATRREVRGLLASVDVFLPNEDEARALTGIDPAGGPSATWTAARELQGDSGGWVVVKLGARGCLAVGPDGAELTAPAPDVTVADTTGAGDAFNAGLIDARARGADWPAALAAATATASAIIARPSWSRHPAGSPGNGRPSG